MEPSASRRFESFFFRLLRGAGWCSVLGLGLESALTRDATCSTIFAIVLGIAFASALPR